MRTCPREVGRTLHTLAVNALNLCGGSPKRSSEIGCTWYSRFGVTCEGSDLVNAPSCDGGIVIAPERDQAYWQPIIALCHHDPSSVLRVSAFLILNAIRSWRWSWRFSPTPCKSCATGIPCC